MNDMKGIPGRFNALLDEHWQNSHSLSIAIIRDKDFIYLSASMKYLLAFDPYTGERKHHFINPDIFNLAREKNDGKIFKGILTVGNGADISYSLYAQIYKEDQFILILAESDIQELYRENAQLSKLNQEINRLQRELLKEKRKLSKANDELTRLNEEKNRYVGMVAHDLISPIGVAGGYAGLILDNYLRYSQETVLNFVKKIKRSSDHSVELIRDVLDLSKIESGTFELKLEKHDYRDFLEEAKALSELIAENKEIGIRLEDGPLILCRFDKEKLTQVISNLLSNSIKYSSRGTEISIEYHLIGDQIKTTVTDQGQGIPEDEIKDLFQAFKTTSVRPTENEKSTGLGLAIVKKILDAHQGKIMVTSEVGVGTSFSFSFPIDL